MSTGEEVKLKNSGLTQKGQDARKKQLSGASFSKNNEYGEKDETYVHSEKSPLSKGTGNRGAEYLTPGSGSSTAYTQQFDTSDGGNIYDRNGVSGAGAKSGRNNLMGINKYGPQSYYGPGSPSTDADTIEINWTKGKGISLTNTGKR